MRRTGPPRSWSGAIVITGVLAAVAFGSAPAASASPADPAQADVSSVAQQSGPCSSCVSPTPATGTPQLVRYPAGTTEQVRQIVQCGSKMYAVGTFSKITWGGKNFARNNIFSFNATAPYKITGWKPNANGEVNTIAFAPGCSAAYIGGSFTSVGGTAVNNIAEISTSTGAVVPAFASNANKLVETIQYINTTSPSHLLVGGKFTTINGNSTDKFMASLAPATGLNDGYLHLGISGNYVYPGVHSNSTGIYNSQLSPGGSKLLVEGTFNTVGGLPRQQIFMLGLGSSATVTGWTSNDFNQHCAVGHPFYVQAAAWSPDGNTVYVATTGKVLATWNKTFPLTGPCDVVAAYPASPASTPVTHNWINYTGCDSLFSVAADSSAVYIGGHERWANNANGCNNLGPGGVPAPGMGGFMPGASGGSLWTNSAGTAGQYSRARGLGADDMLITAAGLWIASDNFDGESACGGVNGHAGICFLPYP